MTDLLRLILDVLTALSPIRTVWTWQRGLVFFAGRYQWTTGPGLKLVVPGLTDVKCVSVVPEISASPLQTITLRDGRTLTYSVSFTYHVEDANKAWNTLGRYQETVVEMVAREVSEELADADPDRLDPARGKRDRLVEKVRETVDKACSAYGLRVTRLGFNNYVLGVRTLRLLLDKAVLTEGNHLSATA